ncbi:MAG TPA: class I SAM-dependent methyltransferase [Pseudonocardiaceae bacterium]|nr:class I SAM-dependent methyltransferase [Pseudonocardiaceae bacterium]
MNHDHAGQQDTVRFTEEFWDDRYRSADRLWSGEPNPQLVAQTADLTPGEALDVGCGEGADAIWLASRGWTVTAVDWSAVALERAAGHAAAQGERIAGRITWQHHDLLSWDPGPQRFDLVSSQFMHLPGPDLDALHRRMAAAVRPGGTLLVVAHHPDDLHLNIGRPHRADLFPSAEQIAAVLDPDDWEILVSAAIGHPATDLDGRPVTRQDTVFRASRRQV